MAALLCCCLGAPAFAQVPDESLCLPGEGVVFACHAEGKLVSLCRPAQPGEGWSYRFGTPASEEFRYPAPGQRARAAFKVGKAPLPGGGVSSVAFQSGGYTYTVYSLVGRGKDGVTPLFEDGVTVERRGKMLRHLRCEDGGAGFREALAGGLK